MWRHLEQGPACGRNYAYQNKKSECLWIAASFVIPEGLPDLMVKFCPFPLGEESCQFFHRPLRYSPACVGEAVSHKCVRTLSVLYDNAYCVPPWWDLLQHHHRGMCLVIPERGGLQYMVSLRLICPWNPPSPFDVESYLGTISYLLTTFFGNSDLFKVTILI